jgi:Calcineurin-like phosphoesterase
VAQGARQDPLGASRAVLAGLLRWALRIGLSIAGAAATLTLFPYQASAGGVHFRIQGTLFARPGFSAETTFGNWEFPHVDALPVGAHISPVNVDLVKMAAAASTDPQAYADRLQHDLTRQLPQVLAWLVGEALIGALLGLGAAMAISLALRYLRGLPRRHRESVHHVRQLTAALVVAAAVIGLGAATYNPDWSRRSRVTGTLATLQLFPGQLQQYYSQQSKAFDVLSAVAAIQAGLQDHIDTTDAPPAAFNIMFISDMHLASTYPLVAQYAKNFDVSLIVNTGDESEFGTDAEMSPAYLAQLRAVTASVPMLWLAGNHDSPATIKIMASIPGVHVIGTKTGDNDAGYTVGAQLTNAYGLTIGAVPDPRVYGAAGVDGSNDATVVHALEEKAMDAAVRAVPRTQSFDIMATHEPVAAAELLKDLPGRIRQTNSGHTHAQNSDSDIQSGSTITLVEGSTGAGGLDNLNRGIPAPPVEFSIESVAADCQFTKLVRFQIKDTAPQTPTQVAGGPQVSASTRYLNPQKLGTPRTCATSLGMQPVTDIG